MAVIINLIVHGYNPVCNVHFIIAAPATGWLINAYFI